MIFDQLKNSKKYFALGENFKRAFEYLSSTDFNTLEPGKYEIDGENLFAIVQDYDTKPATAGKWEAHKKYADIQLIVFGKEKMGYSNFQKMIVTQEYNNEKDAMYLKGEGNFLIAEPGYFALFFPTDVHMPGIAINISTTVRKVVVKVKVTEEHIEEKVITEESVVEEISSAYQIPSTELPDAYVKPNEVQDSEMKSEDQ
jgi:YhcH/YjgK/YiaL family protein